MPHNDDTSLNQSEAVDYFARNGYERPDMTKLLIPYAQLEDLFHDLWDALYSYGITCNNTLEQTQGFCARGLKLPEEKCRELARYFSRCGVNCDCMVLCIIAGTLRPEEWGWVENQCYSDNFDRDDTED
jgi:hypothetical protein